MRSSLQCETQESALTHKGPNECLMLFILPSQAAWAWGYQSVVPLLKVTGGGSGPRRTTVPVRLFNLHFCNFSRLGCVPNAIAIGGEETMHEPAASYGTIFRTSNISSLLV